MNQLFKDILHKWNQQTNQRIKLQQVYFAAVILLAVTSGLVSLLNLELGRTLVMIAALLAAVYVINAISWALVDAFIVRKLDIIKLPATTKKR